MKIIYSPFYSGSYYMNIQASRVTLDVQVLETQGLLSQLALHAGIHHQISPFPERLTSYHKALLEYDNSEKDNIFHRSIEIDSMSVAKTLFRWRDSLVLWGWNKQTTLEDCARLNTLAEIDTYFHDEGIAALLMKLSEQLKLMESGKVAVPQAYKNLIIEIPCNLNLLPDYIKPLLSSLKSLGTTIIEENNEDSAKAPNTITEIHFSQQWKAEAWLTQQKPSAYDVWINTDNKRLDNWLHMSGNPVCGSEMTATNPQITQMFLLAIQLFQRPLNVNTLLQYLFLPECPLDRMLCRELARIIVREGGFCNEKVQECINAYIEREFKAIDDETPQERTREQREENYIKYFPFDLRKDDSAFPLAEESDSVNVEALTKFLAAISSYASNKAAKIAAVQPYDARITQLRSVAEMTDALLSQIDKLVEGELSFTTLNQWTQSLYMDGNFTLYPAQVSSRSLINRPSNMIDKAEKTIWCDFYGDTSTTLSTDFLSNYEMEQMEKNGVLFWNKQNESEFIHLMAARPIYKTSGELTIITCDQQGATKLPKHPLYHQLHITNLEDGDALYKSIPSKEIKAVDNHRQEDDDVIRFDVEKHPVNWRSMESYSSLEKLLQNPFDYFMNYTLQFTDASETDVKLFSTYGNVAHEVVESLFTAEKGEMSLTDFVSSEYEQAFRRALIRKGALLLLPEHHLDRDRLMYQLRDCVSKLATIIQENGLTVIQCEKKEEQDLGFKGGVILQGYIDMLLCDKADNDVVFDLKYAFKKDKYETVLQKNRALQLSIYKAMLMNKKNHSQSVRTAYFVMPYGKLFSTDEFVGENFERVTPDGQIDVMTQLRNGYAERVKEISEGRIETADNKPIREIEYAKSGNVYPLEDDGKMRNPKKAENLYSDYKCFTI